MVDGQAFHLLGENGRSSSGSGTKIQVVPLDEDLDNFEWFYKGKTVNGAWDAKQLIRVINKAKFRYNLLKSNCADIARLFVWYCRGMLDNELNIHQMSQKDSDDSLHSIFKKPFGMLSLSFY